MGDHASLLTRAQSGLGKALANARRDVVYPGHPQFAHVKAGDPDPDPDWIPVVAALRLITINGTNA